MTDEPSDTDENVDPDEVRLMAYILGELDDEEKAEIEARLESDAAFASKRDELEQASQFMKEASANDLCLDDESGEPFQLSKERRESIFKETPPKRSRLLTFNFNHPLVPVAVAASFFCILFSDRILFFRDEIFGDSVPETQQSVYNPQAVPLSIEEEVGQRKGAFDSFISVEDDRRRALLSQREKVLKAKLRENKENIEIVGDKFPGRGDLRISKDEARPRQVISESEQVFNYATTPKSREVNSPPMRVAPQSELNAPEDFKFSIDAIESVKNEAPVIKLKKQDLLVESDALLGRANVYPFGGVIGGSLKRIEAPQASVVGGDDEVYELSPFSINARDSDGYRSTSTRAGTRLNSQLRDVGASVNVDVGYKAGSLDTLPFLHGTSVVTQEFMEDTGAGAARGKSSSTTVVSFFDADFQVPPPPAENDGMQVGGAPFASGRFTSSELAQEIFGRLAVSGNEWNDNFAGRFGSGGINLIDDLLASSDISGPLAEVQVHRIGQDPVEEKRSEIDKAAEPAKSNPALIEYPEFLTAEAPQSTFSLNVSDVSFRLTQSYLNERQLPPAGTLRTEEFINAFDYGDPEPTMEESIGFSWSRARWPYQHDKDLLRFSLKTAAAGRLESQPMNLVLAIDSSGSMARPDRIEIVKTILATIAQDMQVNDRVSVIGFSQDARLILDSVSRDSSEKLNEVSSQLNPRGGTDLEAGLRLAYDTAVRTYRNGAVNRIILFTDGAANLGNTVAEDLTELVEENRQAGVSLDSFGIGFDGHNDVMLERLSRNGDGRYRFLRTADEVETKFGDNLLGSLRPAAYDVKVQVEFNPERVKSYQLLGYQQHQLKSEDFRDNAVDAAEIGAAEAGNALYLTDIDDAGQGDLGVVRVRYRDAATGEYEERSWSLPYNRNVPELEKAPASMRLAAVAASFAALLNESPLAEEIEFQSMINLSRDLQDFYPLDPDVIQLPNLLLRAQQLSGRQ